MTLEEKPVDVAYMADFLGLSKFTVREHAKAKVIPAFKVGGEWRFILSDVMQKLNGKRDPWISEKKPRGRARKPA